jgi:hypothetical protein
MKLIVFFGAEHSVSLDSDPIKSIYDTLCNQAAEAWRKPWAA